MGAFITIPNPSDPLGFDMPIYDGTDTDAYRVLTPGVYRGVEWIDLADGSVETSPIVLIVRGPGAPFDGDTTPGSFYLADIPCTGFWCHETAPHSHTGLFF